MTSVWSLTADPARGSRSAVVTGTFTSYPNPPTSTTARSGVASVSIPWIDVIIGRLSVETEHRLHVVNPGTLADDPLRRPQCAAGEDGPVACLVRKLNALAGA